MHFEDNKEKIIIIDFGSQVTKLIARRVRDLGVFSEIITIKELYKIKDLSKIKGIILSGGPSTVTKKNFPSIPKHGTLFASLLLDIYLASFVSTIVYKIRGLSVSSHSLMILLICCSVLINANSFLTYSKLENWDFNDKNILSKVSPVESDTRYTLYFSFICLLIII